MTPTLQFSVEAEADIQEARRWSIYSFGEQITARYFERLDRELDLLASGYAHGVALAQHDSDLLRYRIASHYVFFRRRKHGIFISRVMHTARLPAIQDFPSDVSK